ncbi:MAG: MBL fold metallo-hydrolase [Oscillospiraceae bacterium]|nr:MBL fold metallo-hydrolase [Oscillospiraceae bacterium]
MLKVATLASGSSGNCSVVSDGRTHILIDAGISAKRIISGLRQLGIEPEKVSAVLITHEHSDHISALPVLTKYIKGDIYTTEPTARQICYRVAGIEDRFRVFDPGDRFLAGGLVAEGFATSHDCACPVGYTLTDGRRKLALCTDTGVVTQEILQAVRGADTLIGEFNYDVDMLRSGPYPAYLKQRILGDRGHLSNEMGGELALFAVEQGARRVIMGHLSKENNLPAVAMAAARRALEGKGVRIGRDMELLAAPRSEATDWMEV